VLNSEEVIEGEQGVVVEDDVHPVGQRAHIGHFACKAADDFVAAVAQGGLAQVFIPITGGTEGVDIVTAIGVMPRALKSL
jgi:hypothetical protein